MKIDTRGIAGFLKRPDPAARAILLYGPDAGLIKERAEVLARTVVEDLADPFRIVDLSGDAIAGDPARLADEAAAIAMTGGRRVVRVRDAGNESTVAFESFLEHPMGDALIIVEGGELDGRSTLRKLFEKSANAAAIACYRDEGRDLAAVVRDTLQRAKVRCDDETLAWLVDRLGGDRLVTRAEIEKLALYVGEGNTATLADARAMVGDSAEIGFDDLANAAASGDVAELERARAKLDGEGIPAIAQLRAVQRHFTRLHLCAGMIAGGRDEKGAMMALRPPVFWKEEAAFRAQLKRWSGERLGRALGRILDAEIQCKSPGAPSELVAARCLMALAMGAR
ncbi:MAG: DNA polymerase III subunit delta [Alphaproteobacteria bacterium]|nr:DNA polymerase III subunit delta [Alphaproteobacteria bacterium]